ILTAALAIALVVLVSESYAHRDRKGRKGGKGRDPPPQQPPIAQRPVIGRKCIWSDYGDEEYGKCSVSCGGGTQQVMRYRYKLYGDAETGNLECIGSSFMYVRTQSCNTQSCPGPQTTPKKIIPPGPGPQPPRPQPIVPPPVPGRKCRWSNYGREKFGPCSVSCGGGTLRVTRKRNKLYGIAETGDPECYGSDTEVIRTQSCNTRPCRDCQWGPWTRWQLLEPCFTFDQRCGVAMSRRSRRCYCNGIEVDPRHCTGIAVEQTTRPCCVDHPGPQPPQPGCGIWGKWMDVPGKCNPPADCTPLVPVGKKRETCVITTYKCQVVRQCTPCPGIPKGCIGVAFKTEDRQCCKTGPKPTTKKQTTPKKTTPKATTTKPATTTKKVEQCPKYTWGLWEDCDNPGCSPFLDHPGFPQNIRRKRQQPFSCVSVEETICKRVSTGCTNCGGKICPKEPQFERKKLKCCNV
ncbi:unnamed protein product, partial [Owenia fusiformis]